jgi:hypothetical protein
MAESPVRGLEAQEIAIATRVFEDPGEAPGDEQELFLALATRFEQAVVNLFRAIPEYEVGALKKRDRLRWLTNFTTRWNKSMTNP